MDKSEFKELLSEYFELLSKPKLDDYLAGTPEKNPDIKSLTEFSNRIYENVDLRKSIIDGDFDHFVSPNDSDFLDARDSLDHLKSHLTNLEKFRAEDAGRSAEVEDTKGISPLMVSAVAEDLGVGRKV